MADAPDEAEFRNRFERVSVTSGHRIIVAEVDRAVVGVLHVFERPALEKPAKPSSRRWLSDGDRRGSGIGEALMREAEAWAGSRKLAATALYTRIDRDRARRFYERIGYRLKATSHLMSEPRA